jgi:hypothetical protein
MNEVLDGWSELGGRSHLFGYIDEEGNEVNGALQNIVDAINTIKSAIGDGIRKYDLVSGKIANDNVGETVSYVVAGVMPREMAIEQLKFQQINDQTAFCSEASLQFLKFVSSYELEVA